MFTKLSKIFRSFEISSVFVVKSVYLEVMQANGMTNTVHCLMFAFDVLPTCLSWNHYNIHYLWHFKLADKELVYQILPDKIVYSQSCYSVNSVNSVSLMAHILDIYYLGRLTNMLAFKNLVTQCHPTPHTLPPLCSIPMHFCGFQSALGNGRGDTLHM